MRETVRLLTRRGRGSRVQSLLTQGFALVQSRFFALTLTRSFGTGHQSLNAPAGEKAGASKGPPGFVLQPVDESEVGGRLDEWVSARLGLEWQQMHRFLKKREIVVVGHEKEKEKEKESSQGKLKVLMPERERLLHLQKEKSRKASSAGTRLQNGDRILISPRALRAAIETGRVVVPLPVSVSPSSSGKDVAREGGGQKETATQKGPEGKAKEENKKQEEEGERNQGKRKKRKMHVELGEEGQTERDVAKKAFEKAADEIDLKSLVIYKDSEFIALNKPFGLASHALDKDKASIERLLGQLRYSSEEKPVLLHRLARDVTGVILLARSSSGAEVTMGRIQGRQFWEKTYWAVLRGRPPGGRREGTVRIALSSVGTHVRDASVPLPDWEGGQAAVTHWRILRSAETGGGLSLVEFRPSTGRRHQIRAHCSYGLRCPVVGDTLYSSMAAKLISGSRPSLFSYSELKGRALSSSSGSPSFSSSSSSSVFEGSGRKGKGEFLEFFGHCTPRLHMHARALRFDTFGGGTRCVTAPLPPHMEETFERLGWTELERDDALARESINSREWQEQQLREGRGGVSGRRPGKGPVTFFAPAAGLTGGSRGAVPLHSLDSRGGGPSAFVGGEGGEVEMGILGQDRWGEVGRGWGGLEGGEEDEEVFLEGDLEEEEGEGEGEEGREENRREAAAGERGDDEEEKTDGDDEEGEGEKAGGRKMSPAQESLKRYRALKETNWLKRAEKSAKAEASERVLSRRSVWMGWGYATPPVSSQTSPSSSSSALGGLSRESSAEMEGGRRVHEEEEEEGLGMRRGTAKEKPLGWNEGAGMQSQEGANPVEGKEKERRKKGSADDRRIPKETEKEKERNRRRGRKGRGDIMEWLQSPEGNEEELQSQGGTYFSVSSDLDLYTGTLGQYTSTVREREAEKKIGSARRDESLMNQGGSGESKELTKAASDADSPKLIGVEVKDKQKEKEVERSESEVVSPTSHERRRRGRQSGRTPSLSLASRQQQQQEGQNEVSEQRRAEFFERLFEGQSERRRETHRHAEAGSAGGSDRSLSLDSSDKRRRTARLLKWREDDENMFPSHPKDEPLD
uniref:Pseudouridylate synthase RPUSD4, mitochondrial n=1 Tax=Chromera velia CCMP2878 TaxID=1169474 RepID=A0A0G4G9K0_9ALVE|eukprot:Cvel_20882.t1-p1 / transcript=Cvel_20882.t1 / gene=Cvel_20882 / organism=Chromera_velia_CCMP2878 / gene_product=Uncharacterized RNA pseudouridine synthase ZMO0505, putative / transcript_product=Uncharacterized RNA pseudouridine synthase ZMO0505, putative / location=Cvel_scaffold1914:11755-22572(+) / protein_length=1084 / sequence_SO=supercontig / SO=protein_coding / is_pseudo=false